MNKPLRLFHIDLLLQITMEEGTLHIHVVYFPSLGSSNGQYQPDGIHPSYRSKCLIVVLALDLRIPFFHQPSLVLGCGPINNYFGFVDPFSLYQLPSWR